MGGPSAQFKQFADATSKAWFTQKWKDKIAAGFTNSATMNGDKFSTIQYFVTLSMQHGMVWVGTSLMSRRADISTPDEGPLPGDLETGKAFGRRVAEATARWVAGRG